MPAQRHTRPARLTGLRHAALSSLLALCSTAIYANDSQWLSREIPPAIADLLAEESPVQGLFSTRFVPAPQPVPDKQPALRVLPTHADRPTALPPPDTSRPLAAEPLKLPDLLDDLPRFPEALFQQVPRQLEQVTAPRSESKGVPEPQFIREVWTFSTPVDRIAPLLNSLGEPGKAVYDLPSSLSRVDHLQADGLTPEHWLESARLHKLPVEALYAIALQESGIRTASGDVQPWPWTLNCNAPCPHGAMRFASRAAATEALAKLLKAGWRNIDIGAMQINYRAHARRFASYDLLDPRINVIIGGVILREAVQKARGNLRNGFTLYHVGSLQGDNASRGEQYANSVGRWVQRVKRDGGLKVASR